MDTPISQVSNVTVAPFVDGVLSPSANDTRVAVFNPSNGQSLLEIPEGCEADADRAVRAARRAFDAGSWSEAPPSFKKRVLHRFADLIASAGEELDRLDAQEMGKPIGLARANAASAASLMRFHAEAADKLTGQVYSSDKHSFVTYRHVPRGVVAAIVPWNFPTYAAVLKVAPALAAGNSVVLKPSELASRSAVRLAQLGLEAGLPPGVLNVAPGLGTTVGRALGLHKDVDMVSFTGSTQVGKQMLQYAGQSNMKVVLAECGGKSPHIVFDDGIDPDVVAEAIARMLLTNQGQVCSAGSRLLVQRPIEAAVLAGIARRSRAVVMGDALDAKTTFGPLASSRQRARVMQYIEEAREAGAELVAGGNRARPESGGYFVEPALFRNVAPAAKLAQEEIFGPVLSVMTFADEGEAIQLANSTAYGLMAYVWTRDLSTGMRMARSVRSAVSVYSAAPAGEGAGHAPCHEPAGESGLGTEGGLAGLESYQLRQRVSFTYAGQLHADRK